MHAQSVWKFRKKRIRTTKLYKESLNTNYSIISTSKDKEDLNYIYSHKRY